MSAAVAVALAAAGLLTAAALVLQYVSNAINRAVRWSA